MLPPPTLRSFTRIEPGAVFQASVLLSRWKGLSAGDLRVSYYNLETDGEKFKLNAWMGTVLSGSKKSEMPNLEGGVPR